jgi:sugar/nucleoside kinase (ribokinase family)
VLIAVIGDCLLDISVRPSGPMRLGADAPAAIRLSPGGQGANVAVWLARRGAAVRLIAPMADDAAGRLLRETLAAEAVELAPLPAARTGSVVALLDAEGERTMLSDRSALAVDDLAELLAGADWIHVSGYALRDPAGEAIARAIDGLPEEIRVSIGGGSLPAGAEAARFGDLVRLANPELLIVSTDEARALGTGFSAITITTAAAQGSSAFGPGMQRIDVPAAELAGPVLDTTGAGDAYAAALIGELAHRGDWPPPVAEFRRAMEVASSLGAEVARAEGAQGRVG